ncbi:MAG: amidohydrolase family protein [Acidimicrobiia bacterium]
MTTYDVHAHCIPDELIDLLRADGSRFGIEVVADDEGESAVIAGRVRLAPFRSILGDTEARIAAMDATGVDIQVLSSWVDLTAYALEPEQGAAYSRRFNQILADHAAAHPERLLALGTVPLQSPNRAAEELHFGVEDLGLIGVEIATTVDQSGLDQAGLDPFWEAAETLGCLVLIHPCNPLPGVDLSRYFLDNMVGRPAESTIAIAQLLFSGVLERFPGLQVCVVHGGGFLPFQIGRMQRGYEAVPVRTAQHISTPPAEQARRLYYDTVLHDSAALAFLVGQMGADRVLLGTDYPFEMGDPEPVATIASIPSLSDDQRRQIMGENVSRILAGMGR